MGVNQSTPGDNVIIDDDDDDVDGDNNQNQNASKLNIKNTQKHQNKLIKPFKQLPKSLTLATTRLKSRLKSHSSNNTCNSLKHSNHELIKKLNEKYMINNLFKNYKNEQLNDLLHEYEYLDLLNEFIYKKQFHLIRIPLTLNEKQSLNDRQLTKYIKFYFINDDCNTNNNEFIKIDTQQLIKHSNYFAKLLLTRFKNNQNEYICMYLNKSLINYNEMYFIKKFLSTHRINIDLFFNSIHYDNYNDYFSGDDMIIENNFKLLINNKNEENYLKLLQFYYKSCFFEIDTLTQHIESLIMMLVEYNEDVNDNTDLNELKPTTKLNLIKNYVFLLNITSSSSTYFTLYEYLYQKILNKFILNFNWLFFNSTIDNGYIIELTNFTNKSILIDLLKSTYLDINELDLFNVCLNWSKKRVKNEKYFHKIKNIYHHQHQNHSQFGSNRSSGGNNSSSSSSSNAKLKKFFLKSFNLTTHSPSLIRSNNRSIRKLFDIDDDYVCVDDKDDNDDNKKLLNLLNEFIKHVNVNHLFIELHLKYNDLNNNSQEYSYLINLLNLLCNNTNMNKSESNASLNTITTTAAASDDDEDNNGFFENKLDENLQPPDFILNDKYSTNKCRSSLLNANIKKPLRLNKNLMQYLSFYLKQIDNNAHTEELSAINLPDMINSTLKRNNCKNSVEEIELNQFDYKFDDLSELDLFAKMKLRYQELKKECFILYKHKKSSKNHLNNILKLRLFREFNVNLFNNCNDYYLFDYFSCKFDYYMKIHNC